MKKPINELAETIPYTEKKIMEKFFSRIFSNAQSGVIDDGMVFKLVKDYGNILGKSKAEIVIDFNERVINGLETYGPIFKNKKNLALEAYEEFLDAAFYLLCWGYFKQSEESEKNKKKGNIKTP